MISQFKKQLCKKRQGPESTSSQATKRADIKIWPRNFCDLGNKEFKHCYLTVNHNAYVVTQQSYVISFNSKFKDTSQILSAIMQPQHSKGILDAYCF